MAKHKKKTPKSTNKKKQKKKDILEIIITFSIIIIFFAVIIYLFYFINMTSGDEFELAVVNGKEITNLELDWWYKLSVLPDYRDSITKRNFLITTIIPQEVLLQKAREEKIEVSNDEIEKFLGLFIINSGQTLDEFDQQLESQDITIDDIRKSFKIRIMIQKLLEKENIVLGRDDQNFQEYMDSLMDNSEIEIIEENIERLAFSGFELTGDELCEEGKPIVRLYTTSWCEVCNDSSKVFNNLINEFDGSISSFHWSLDTGDDLLTRKKEKGVPKAEIELFNKYSPDNLVPTVVLGCKYQRIGSFGDEESDEFRNIVRTLIEG